ncbi:L,D-transpeptidase [Conexibacter sp. CPCC 206217]|uniref:L,D-transpeptidase n=1 Tax=Conexibacter sp. CPCC 206217 TaxID=3064574 RepID=UPI00271BFD58|nr:L,D-transpeptidase [Conexibacter sp. CPCC 206217]MDO8213207.1 L,D-transpeptidase [Conexibacter sp. CPCC 206217]
MSHRTTKLLSALTVVLLVLATAAGAQATSLAPTVERQLSNERTSSFWAYPARVATIRAAPSVHARSVAQTQIVTEIGQPNVYLVLAEAQVPGDGGRWLKIRVPGRPNGRVGWVPRDALGPLRHVTTQIVVDRKTLTATLRDRGRTLLRVPVGVGAAATPTPVGHFWVREKLRFDQQPVYGTRALGTSAYAPTLTEWPAGGVVGLHGTDEPWLIPGRPSHGCVRIRNADMARLWERTPIGTPVLIR